MKPLQNLKQHICSFENLLGAYRDAAACKRYRDEVLAFSEKLEENLFRLRYDLLTQTYTVGRYREFYVQYPKPRLVMALGFRDRIVQWAIYRQINPFIDKRFIEHSYGCRKDKGTLKAAQQLCQWMRLIDRKADAEDWYLIKGDIAKYFYRIDHDLALQIYAEITDDEWFLWLMGVIIRNPEVPFGLPEGRSIDDCPREERLYEIGMPIGNLTSQETANIYLDRLDQYCKHRLKLHFYIRYMDDFIILIKGRAEAEKILLRITEFLRRKLKLSISPKSTINPMRHGCEFVGCRISPHGIRLRKKTIRHAKRALKHTAELYALGAIPLDRCFETVNSYLGMTKHKNGYHLRRWIEENIVFQRNEVTRDADEELLPAVGE